MLRAKIKNNLYGWRFVMFNNDMGYAILIMILWSVVSLFLALFGVLLAFIVSPWWLLLFLPGIAETIFIIFLVKRL